MDNIEEWALALLMGVMACIVFIQVVFRTIGGSLPWSEELSRYMTVWITFIGVSYGVKKKAHIGVEAFTLMCPKNIRRLINFIVIIICAVFCVICIKYGVDIIMKQIAMKQVSPAMRVPMWWAYLGIPVGMTMAFLRYVEAVFDLFASGRADADAKGGDA